MSRTFALKRNVISLIAIALACSLLSSPVNRSGAEKADKSNDTASVIEASAATGTSIDGISYEPNLGDPPTADFEPATPIDPIKNPPDAKAIPGEVIVTFKQDATEEEKAELRASIGGSDAEFVSLADGTELIQLKSGISVAAANKVVESYDFSEFSEPNYVITETAISDDPSVIDGSTWGLLGNGSTVSSTGANTMSTPQLGAVPANSATASMFAGLVVDFLDPYSTTKNKTVRSLNGFAGNWIALHSVLHMSTSAVSSIELIGQNGNLAIGTRVSLYGIKG
jgi:hypothetical protein